MVDLAMKCFLFFSLVSSAVGSVASWYPVVMPIHTHHRHTTHVVSHPVTHTRVLVLGDDDHHHHHRHNHGHNHLHKHGHDHKHDHSHKHGHQHLQHQSPSHRYQQLQVYKRSKALGVHQASRHNQDVLGRHEGYEDYYRDEEEYSQEEQGYGDYSNHQFDPPIKYSVPVSESPWKPILHFPKGYVPLKYLGIDEERVAAVVKQAMSEIENDIEGKRNLVSSVGSRSYRKFPLKLRSPNSLNSGAVYYDRVGKHADNQPRYGAGSYEYKDQPSTGNPKTYKLNIECHCEDPHA